MNIGLIDVDGHHYPNLALMKISAAYKQLGEQVEWWRADHEYDIVCMAKVFGEAYSPDMPLPKNTKVVIKGGTGYAIDLEDGLEVYHSNRDKSLPNYIEHIYPDYSLYPEYTGFGQTKKKQTAYGFMTRGCPRNCEFCIVGTKEGRCSIKVADLSEFWKGQGTIKLSDPNILASWDAKECFEQLINSQAKIQFNQGLDARFITQSKADMLARMKLITPHFAMDTMSTIEPVSAGIKHYVEAYKNQHNRWNWRNAKVFCLVNFNTTPEEDLMRIKLIQKLECQPYVMIYNKPSAPPIARRLQRWTNSTFLYAKYKNFYDYQKATYKKVIEI